jgi:hypothetical protein
MSLPAKDLALKKHPKAICWSCLDRKDEFLPYPCKAHKRWQSEGICTDMRLKGVG